jgi:hypothetical protein
MPAVLLVCLSMAGCNVTMSVILLTLSVTVIGAFSSGFYQNPLDIAPNFAGMYWSKFFLKGVDHLPPRFHDSMPTEIACFTPR